MTLIAGDETGLSAAQIIQSGGGGEWGRGRGQRVGAVRR